jgi:hypothetical protein
VERLEKETGESSEKNLTKNEKKAKVPEGGSMKLKTPRIQNDEWTLPAIRHPSFRPQLAD